MRMTKRMWEGRAAQAISIHLCVCLCVCEYLLNEWVCMCVCALGRVLFCYLFVWIKRTVRVSNTSPSHCAAWGMPVGWLLPTWPTPRDSRSALRFSPMPRTSNKTWLSPITGPFWMAWPRTGATTLAPLSRAAASWMACPTERGRSMAWKQTRWRRRDLTVRRRENPAVVTFRFTSFFFQVSLKGKTASVSSGWNNYY